MSRLFTRTRVTLCAVLAAVTVLSPSVANAGGDGLDRRVNKNTSGIFAAQDAVPVALALFSGGCALWEGTESPLGKTCWESAESIGISALSTEALQYATGREGPSQTDDPGRWFTGKKGTFPSLHVAVTTAAVTPFILNNFEAHPWLSSALALVPAYEMVARVKAQEHWQTDVLAGAVLGAAVGVGEAYMHSPFVFGLLPGGAFVGFHTKF